MEGMRSLFLIFLIVVAMASVLYGQSLGPNHGKVVACYLASWAVFRKAPATFAVEDIDPTLCTHIIYSFAGVNEKSFKINSLDPWQDLDIGHGRAAYKRVVALKERFPHLKVTISVGGWNEGSLKFSKMVAEPENREKFIQSVLLFLNTHKFDGLDLDWEFPTRREGGRPEDKANLISLIKELKEAFKPHDYILTAALAGGKDTLKAAYDLGSISRYLDLIHMLCYDYHGPWGGVIGANAPLRGVTSDDVQHLEYTIKYMRYRGVSPSKMVLGLPTFGRPYVLLKPSTNVIEFGTSPVRSEGFAGPVIGDALSIGYNEICMEIANKSSKWTYHWHEPTSTPYLRDGERIIAYDNARSIANKVKLAVDYGLAGVMVRYIDTDDLNGECKGEPDAYIDFVNRFNCIGEDNPLLLEALKNLTDANLTHYIVLNDRPDLRLPQRLYSNYNLMRTINDAITLALEEKRVTEELEFALNKIE